MEGWQGGRVAGVGGRVTIWNMGEGGIKGVGCGCSCGGWNMGGRPKVEWSGGGGRKGFERGWAIRIQNGEGGHRRGSWRRISPACGALCEMMW